MTETVAPEALIYDHNATMVIMQGLDNYELVTARNVSNTFARAKAMDERIYAWGAKAIALEEYLKSNLDDLGEHAKEIAEIFDLELTKDLHVTLTYTLEANITVPYNYDVDEDDFDLSLEAYGSDVELYDWSVYTSQCSVSDKY